jgi:Cys-rich protein (TIGR01571 family)
MKKNAAYYAFSFMFQTAIVFGVAWLLRQYGPTCLPQELAPDRDPEVGRAVFAYGLMDEKECWSEDLILCIVSCCCPGIQWANNVSNPKIGLVGSFWVALMLASLNSPELYALTHGICYFVWVAIAVTARHRLRGKYGLENGSLVTLFQDIFVWCCCHKCAVAQEARQVAHVRTLDISNTPYGDATQLQVDEEPTSSRRTLLRPTEEGMGRENTANSEVSGL